MGSSQGNGDRALRDVIRDMVREEVEAVLAEEGSAQAAEALASTRSPHRAAQAFVLALGPTGREAFRRWLELVTSAPFGSGSARWPIAVDLLLAALEKEER